METISSEHKPSYLWANLRAGTRTVLGLRVSVEDFRISLDQALWLLLSVAALETLIGYLATAEPAVFDSYGVGSLATSYLIGFLLLLLVARLAGGGAADAGRLLFVDLATTPALLVLTELAFALQPSGEGDQALWGAWALYAAVVFWHLMVLVRILSLLLPLRVRKALVLGLASVGLQLAAAWTLPQSSLWYTEETYPANSPYAAMQNLNVENIFYAQPSLMASALAPVAEQRPGVTDLYLLAFAGYGYEKVFLNEVEYVRSLFDREFGTRDRSLVMVNNAATVERYPLANRHNLSQALADISARMDPDEDVLFLFMTSHGTQDHRLSVNFGPVQLEDLKPAQIRQALDNAGIRWRVLVISSCYSGGFVAPLKDPNTLIITAAAADRQSFGCGAQSEFTDFGDAYFRRALQQAPDFVEAFYIAERLVAEQEQAEQRMPSKPQIAVGDAIRAKLSGLTAGSELVAEDRPVPAG